MPRSASDATRFTPTGPYAQSYGNASSATTSARIDPFIRSTRITLPTSPPPANETPQQKVARLREASRLAKIAQEPTLERFLIRGRSIADKVHKGTVVGLVSLTVVCTGMAAYSVGDMMRYNRRKAREFYQEQQRNYDIALQRAIRAEQEGVLTPDLALVLNKERAVLAYEEEQAKKGGLVKQAKDWLFGGLTMQEHPGGRLGKGGFDAEEIKRIAEGSFIGAGAGEPRPLEAQKIKSQSMADEAVQESKRGGALDILAEHTVNDVRSKSKSWWRWAAGR